MHRYSSLKGSIRFMLLNDVVYMFGVSELNKMQVMLRTREKVHENKV